MSRRDDSSKGKVLGRGGNNVCKGSYVRGNVFIKKDIFKYFIFRENKGGVFKKKLGDGICLNKYIVNSGICFCCEVDIYIVIGLVIVNGKIINEMGY